MSEQVNVLDHGYVKVIERWGSDEGIIESARMSTDGAFRGWGPHRFTCASYATDGALDCDCPRDRVGDEGLLRYLYEDGHSSPFEQAGVTLEVQAPIFVFREWHRHRTQSYNELSARYTPLPDLFYVPSVERLMSGMQAKKNKQSSVAGFTETDAQTFAHYIQSSYTESRETYEYLLKNGVAREIARVVIPVAQYSRMRASANLTNWLRFLRLRIPESAQWEIRQYSQIVHAQFETLFPRTMALFAEERRLATRPWKLEINGKKIEIRGTHDLTAEECHELLARMREGREN